mgnify:CR=1 FL=1|tara:strand:+ start:1391 stop:1897 length:507 start_codon:yes stop_codon:yes gene_type:complete
MGRFSERRALYYEDDETFNPVLSVDVNEYLIETYEATSLKQRRAIWSLCQNDTEFDYSTIENQIDVWVTKYAETDPNMNTNLKDNSINLDYEDEEEYIDDSVTLDIREYLDETYDNVPEDEADDLIYLVQSHIDWSPIYKQLEKIIDDYYEGNYDEFLEESEEDEDEE